MVIRELIATALEFITGVVGVEGLAIGGLAIATAGLWYLREAADLFVVLARYARVLSLIGFVVLVLYVVGTATGFVDTGSAASVVGSLVNQLTEMVH